MTEIVYDEIEYQRFSNAFFGGYNNSELGSVELWQESVIPEYEKCIGRKKELLSAEVKQLAILKKYGVITVLSILATADTLRQLYYDRQSAIGHLSGEDTGMHGKERAEYGIVNINRDIKALKAKMNARDWAICKAWGYEKEK